MPATEAWTGDGYVGPEEPWADRFFAPSSPTFVLLAALPKPDGTTDEAFATDYIQRAAERAPCPVPLDAWTNATVGDAPAQRAEFECGGSRGVEMIRSSAKPVMRSAGEPAVVDVMAPTITYE